MTPAQIDEGVVIMGDLVKVLGQFYAPAALAAPFIMALVKLEAWRLKAGIADGSLVDDGLGGLVPAHGQSIYDPRTGEFTGRRT